MALLVTALALEVAQVRTAAGRLWVLIATTARLKMNSNVANAGNGRFTVVILRGGEDSCSQLRQTSLWLLLVVQREPKDRRVAAHGWS
jgi:hypothetical protein